jgi:hypothetical protein
MMMTMIMMMMMMMTAADDVVMCAHHLTMHSRGSRPWPSGSACRCSRGYVCGSRTCVLRVSPRTNLRRCSPTLIISTCVFGCLYVCTCLCVCTCLFVCP